MPRSSERGAVRRRHLFAMAAGVPVVPGGIGPLGARDRLPRVTWRPRIPGGIRRVATHLPQRGSRRSPCPPAARIAPRALTSCGADRARPLLPAARIAARATHLSWAISPPRAAPEPRRSLRRPPGLPVLPDPGLSGRQGACLPSCRNWPLNRRPAARSLAA
jgi:hypothetical protein